MVVVGKKSAPSRISSDEGVVGEWRAVGVKQMVVVTEKATRGGECLMGGGGGQKCDGGVVGVKRRVWWPKKQWVWWVKWGVKQRVLVGNKHLPSQILSDGSGGWWWPKKSPSVSHFEWGRGGVCWEEDVGGQQNPSILHLSASAYREVVVVSNRW